MPDLASLKICFIAGTLGQGGAERQLFYILKALRESGSDVRLLSLSRGEYWEQPLRELGIPVTWVGQHESKFSRLCRILFALRKQPPDIFQSQHFYTNPYVVAGARALGLREVGAIRNDGKSEMRINGQVLGNLSLRTPRSIAANSWAGIRHAIDLGVPDDRLHFLPNVVDCEQFKPVPRLVTKPVRLLIAGRLVKQKRVDRFLSLLSRLRANHCSEFRGIVVGDGPLRTELEQQALSLGLLPNVVQFKGAVADMAAVYREADILVSTSDYEGTPNVLLEAMATGLPVVATSVGGVDEVVRDGETGYLAEPEGQGALFKALLKMIGDGNLRREFGAYGREYVLAHHSANRLPVYLDELYRTTLS